MLCVVCYVLCVVCCVFCAVCCVLCDVCCVLCVVCCVLLVDEALTGSVPARPTTAQPAQPAHGPNSTTPPATQRSPFHGASVAGAMSHSPHSSPASKPKPPSGAHMASAGAGASSQTYNYLPADLQAMYASGEQ